MKTGNGVPAANDRQQAVRGRGYSPLKDIEELVARLEDVNRKLKSPARAMPTPRTPESRSPEAGSAGTASDEV
jgi:S-adenosylmethionine synthetase